MSDVPEKRGRECWERTCDYISLLSIGKYSTKLYHRGRSDYSCCASGLFTVGLLLVILLASISILSTTFSRTVRTLTETTSQLANSTFINKSLLELEELGIAPPLIRTTPMFNVTVNCSEVVVSVAVSWVINQTAFSSVESPNIRMKLSLPQKDYLNT